jgi:hypothetical protein
LAAALSEKCAPVDMPLGRSPRDTSERTKTT